LKKRRKELNIWGKEFAKEKKRKRKKEKEKEEK